MRKTDDIVPADEVNEGRPSLARVEVTGEGGMLETMAVNDGERFEVVTEASSFVSEDRPAQLDVAGSERLEEVTYAGGMTYDGAAPDGFVMECSNNPFLAGDDKQEDDLPKYEPPKGSCPEVQRILDLTVIANGDTDLELAADATDAVKAKQLEAHRQKVAEKQNALAEIRKLAVTAVIAEGGKAVEHMKHVLDGDTEGPFEYLLNLDNVRIEDVKPTDVAGYDDVIESMHDLLTVHDKAVEGVRKRITDAKLAIKDTEPLNDDIVLLKSKKKNYIIEGRDFTEVDAAIKAAIAKQTKVEDANRKLSDTATVLTEHVEDLGRRRKVAEGILEHACWIQDALHCFILAGEINQASEALGKAVKTFADARAAHKERGIHNIPVRFPISMGGPRFLLPRLVGATLIISENGNWTTDPALDSSRVITSVNVGL